MAATQIATATATVAAVAATACFTNGFHVQCVMFLGKDCSAWLVMAMSGLKYNKKERVVNMKHSNAQMRLRKRAAWPQLIW